jgi:hypothetical protein
MCQIPCSGSELPGLAGLRSSLLAMYVGGPATMRLGPLVVSHTAGGMFRGIALTAGEAQTLDAGDPSSPPTRSRASARRIARVSALWPMATAVLE